MATPTGDVPGKSLRAMVAAPTIWAAHFLLCYIVAAVYCAKAAAPVADLGPVRIWVALVTVLALGGIATCGVSAFRYGGFERVSSAPHDADTISARRRFLSYSTLLLSGLSFVATLYVALPVLFIASCR
jgi:hypothetical protein